MADELAVKLSLKDRARFSREAREAAADVEDIGDAAGRAESKSRGWLSKIGGGLVGIGKAAAGVAAGVAGLGAVFGGVAIKKGIDRLTTIEDATASLNIILGDTSKTAAFMDDILETVSGTPYNLDQFANAGKNLVAFGADAKKVPGWLEAIGESAAASGKGAEAVDWIVDSLGKAQAAGKIGMETINSLSAQGVPALQILANSFGKSTDEMRKMISKGAVPAEEGIDRLAKGIMEGTDGAAGATVAFAGSMAGLRETFTGAKGGLGAAVARFGTKIIGPFMGHLTSGMTWFGDTLDAVGGRVEERVTAVAETLSGFVTDAVDNFRKFSDGFTTGMNLTPMHEWGVRLGDVKADIDRFVANTTSLWLQFKAGMDKGLERTSMQEFGASVSGWWERLADVGSTLADAAKDLWPSLRDLGGALATASASIGISTWEILLVTVELLAQVLADVLVPMLTTTADWLSSHQGVVTGLLLTYMLWRGAVMAITFGKLVTGIWTANAALFAWRGGMIDHIRLLAMMAADHIRTAARVVQASALKVVAWARERVMHTAITISMIANSVKQRVAVVGSWIAQKVAAVASLTVTAAKVAWAWATMAAKALWGAARMAASWLIAMGPVGWVIAAVIALVALIVANWDTVKEWTLKVFGAVWGFIQDVWEKIKAGASAVGSWISEKWNATLAFFQGIPGRIASVASSMWDSVKNSVTTAKDWVTGKFDEVVGFVRGLPSKISSAASGMWDGIKESFKGAVNWIIDKWNNLSFTIGGQEWDLPGPMGTVSIPSMTLSTPNIPRLHTGGTTRTGGAAIIEPREEAVVLPPAASVVPVPTGQVPATALGLGGAGGHSGPLTVQVVLDRKVLGEVTIDDLSDRLARR